MDKMSEGARSTTRLDSESDFEQGMTKFKKKLWWLHNLDRGGNTTWVAARGWVEDIEAQTCQGSPS